MKDTVSQNITVAIHHHIDDIPKKEWNTLVGNTLFHTCAWMELLEHSVREDVIPHYITVMRNDHLVGAGVCYMSDAVFLNRRIKRLACMCSFSEKMAFFIKKGEDNLAIFSFLYSAAEEIAKEHKAHMMFIAYVSDESVLHFLKEKGFSMVKEEPTTYLDVQWKTFKEYLKSLPRKAKKNIRHILNQGKRKGLKLEHSHDFSDADHLFRIYTEHLERHQYEHSVPFTAELFRNFEKYIHEYAYIVRCCCDSNLLGYWVYFYDGTHATMAISGIDYTYPREYDAYFNICYDAVREMIEKGCSQIHFGASTYTVKRRIGCTLKETVTAVKLCNPVLNVGYKVLVWWRNLWMERAAD